MPPPARHLQLLRERLERDHVVPFKNGAQVEFEDCPRCGAGGKPGKIHKPGRHPIEAVVWITCPTCRDGEGTRLRVEGSLGHVDRFLWPDELARAYELAANGAAPIAQPKGDPADYGDTPPW